MSSTSTARKVLVTGAGAGIGEAVARAFATDGAHVTVADVDAEAAHRVAHEIGGTAWVVDLSDSEALADLRLDCDVLVNNAGVQYVSPVEDFPPEKFHLILNLMLEAPFLLIRAALPHMYANGFGRGEGLGGCGAGLGGVQFGGVAGDRLAGGPGAGLFQLRGGLGNRQVQGAEVAQYVHDVAGKCKSLIYTRGA